MKVRYFSLSLVLVSFIAGDTLCAATKPHTRRTSEANVTWTNEDLERLRDQSPISVIGQIRDETNEAAAAPTAYLSTKDPAWYTEQAANLRMQLESRQAELQRYRQALEDARGLKTMTGGINLDQGDIGITPEAAIEILEGRVQQTQSELDDLEDLARRNDIPPGILRGQ